MASTWFRHHHKAKSTNVRKEKARRLSFRPRLEGLEERWAPATVTNLDDDGAGSLRQAIDITPNGGTVDFKPGLTGTIKLASQLKLNKSLTVKGPGSDSVKVSGNNASRVFDVLFGNNVSLSGLTIADGNAPFGAGFSNAGGLTLDDCVITENSAVGVNVTSKGGGIFSSGSLSLTNTTVSKNSVSATGSGTKALGGGVFSTGSLFLFNVSISSNTASGVTGVAAGVSSDGTSTFINTTVSGNKTTGTGGQGSGASSGILNGFGGTMTLTNVTVSGNTANGPGAGIGNIGTLSIFNSTIAKNTSTGIGSVGGGLFKQEPSKADLRNSIIAGNSADSNPDVSGDISSTSDHNLIRDGTGMTGITNGANGNKIGTAGNPIDPLLGALQNNGGPTQTRAILVGSPAIDSGTNADAPLSDQRGFNRTVRGVTDIGAYEFQPAVTKTILGSHLSELKSQKAGLPLTLFATVTALAPGSNTPTGTVTFLDGPFTQLGTVSLSNGEASLTTTSLPAGKHSITARYDGLTVNDHKFDQSTSPALAQTIRNGAFFAVGGGNGKVQIRKTTDGSLVTEFAPYGSFNAGVSVAVGDVDFDGFDEIITGTSLGNPHVKIYKGRAFVNGTFNSANPDASLQAQWFAYGLQFNVGANIAVGDINFDGFADVVTGATAGNPHTKVYSGKQIANGNGSPTDANVIASWFPYALQFNVGANVAAGDVNSDGFADVITGANIGNPHVKVHTGEAIADGTFNNSNPDASVLKDWFSFGLQFNVGANVAVGDVNGDGFGDIITGASISNPHVKVYDGKAIATGTFNSANPDASLLTQFFAYGVDQGIGVSVGAADFETNGKFDILTGARGGSPIFKVLRPSMSSGVDPTIVFEGTLAGFPAGLSVGA